MVQQMCQQEMNRSSETIYEMVLTFREINRQLVESIKDLEEGQNRMKRVGKERMKQMREIQYQLDMVGSHSNQKEQLKRVAEIITQFRTEIEKEIQEVQEEMNDPNLVYLIEQRHNVHSQVYQRLGELEERVKEMEEQSEQYQKQVYLDRSVYERGIQESRQFMNDFKTVVKGLRKYKTRQEKVEVLKQQYMSIQNINVGLKRQFREIERDLMDSKVLNSVKGYMKQQKQKI